MSLNLNLPEGRNFALPEFRAARQALRHFRLSFSLGKLILSSRHPGAEFLPGVEAITRERPPAVVWALPLTLSILTLSALAWSVTARLDIVSTAQGQLVPTGHVKIVQAAAAGVVQQIRVHNGSLVQAGDVLISLDNREALAALDQATQELMDARLDVARLNAALDGRGNFDTPQGASAASVNTQFRLLEASRLSLESQLSGLDQERLRLEASRRAVEADKSRALAILPLVKQRYESRKELLARQIVTRTEVLQLEQEYVTQRQDLAVIEAQIGEADAQLRALADQRQEVIRSNRRDLLRELADAERKVAAADTRYTNAEDTLLRMDLTAPVTGLVHDLKVATIGAVVQPGEELARVVPSDAEMEVEAKVANRDRAYVEIGQPVAVKFDAFEFTRYGAVSGRVVSISSDVLPDEKLGPVYQVRVALDSQSLKVDGREAHFTPGMSASIDIRTGDRRAIDYLLEPALKASAEALRER